MFIPFSLRVVLVLSAIFFVGMLAPAFLPIDMATNAQYGMCWFLLFGILISYRIFIVDLLRYLLEHPGQASILVLLLAMLYGWVGVAYGIPEVFWSEYGLARMLTALAIVSLLSVLGINAYFFDPLPSVSRVKRRRYLDIREWRKFSWTRRQVEKTWLGSKVSTWLFDDLPRNPFTNAHDLQQFLRLVRLPFLTLVSLPALFPLVFPFVPRVAPTGDVVSISDPNVAHGGIAWMIGVLWWSAGIFGGILLNRALLRFSALIEAVRIDHEGIRERRPRFARLLAIAPAAGALRVPWWLVIPVVLLAATLTCIDAAGLDSRMIDSQVWATVLFVVDCIALGLITATISQFTARQHEQLWGPFQRYLVQVTVFLMGLIVWDSGMHALSTGLGWRQLSWLEVSPGMAVCVLLALVALLSGWFYLLGSESKCDKNGDICWVSDPSNPAARVRQALPLFLALVIWIGLVNNSPYKARFPNLRYSDPVDLISKLDQVYPALKALDPPSAQPALLDNVEASGPELISNEDLLEKWVVHARKAQGTSRPKLVVICCSGGASRAAFWTAVVLERLRKTEQLKGFDQAVRIITGASGGMVGASYYVSELVSGDSRKEQRERAGMSSWIDDIETNPLPRVASHIALRELGLMMLPRIPFTNIDRGTVLEDQFVWKSDRKPALDLPLQKLREAEKEGTIPSLIYTPVIVDDGRRLLVSNLDLGSLAVNRGTELTERYRKDDQGSYTHVVSSLAGLEFFKFFDKNGADRLTLATAARMSASFPFVSPAVNLPSKPPLRLVDAGYYDNFGANLAAIWIGENWQKLQKLDVSGVVLIQIRAFVGRQERAAPLTGREPAFDLTRGYELLGTPIKAFGAGRFTGSVFRNDAELSALIEVVNEKAKQSEFLTTVVFENSSVVQVAAPDQGASWPGSESDEALGGRDEISPNTEVAMTWNVTQAERRAMLLAIPSEELAKKERYRDGRPDYFSTPSDRLLHIRDLASRLQPKVDPKAGPDQKKSTEVDPRLLQQTRKSLERVLNYERVEALKLWWNTHNAAQ